MDLLENLVSKIVNQRVRKLEARLSDLQLEVPTRARALSLSLALSLSNTHTHTHTHTGENASN
jgi:hypothetical protein